MRLLINNYLEDAAFTVNGAVDSFPIENLISQSLTDRVQFNDWIEIDMGVDRSINSIAFSNSSEASITIQAKELPGTPWSTPDFEKVVSDSVTFVDLAGSDYRYWRIYTGEIASRLGYLYLGNYLQLPHNGITNYPTPLTNDVENETSTGQVHSFPGVVYKEEKVKFPYVTNLEKLNFENWWQSNDRANNHFFIPYENNFSEREPYFAKVYDYDPDRIHKINFFFSIKVLEAK